MQPDVSGPSEVDDLRDRFVAAALEVLAKRGAAELTLRRVAQAAGASTMGIYTRFGSRAAMLEAVYLRGFEMLREALLGATDGPAEAAANRRIIGLLQAYRRFALANPELYALMFERPLPDFDPPAGLRTRSVEMTFPLLRDEVDRALGVDDPTRAAYMIWSTIHGTVSLEMTHTMRSPVEGWYFNVRGEGERVLIDGVQALIAGLPR
jgi:AcrR family transcriptional regulator